MNINQFFFLVLILATSLIVCLKWDNIYVKFISPIPSAILCGLLIKKTNIDLFIYSIILYILILFIASALYLQGKN